MWKVKWGDIERDFERKIQISEASAPIKSYFEDEKKILTFIRLRGQTLYAEVPKSELKDEAGFKLQFLSDSYELQENPLTKKPLKIVTEQRLQ